MIYYCIFRTGISRILSVQLISNFLVSIQPTSNSTSQSVSKERCGRSILQVNYPKKKFGNVSIFHVAHQILSSYVHIIPLRWLDKSSGMQQMIYLYTDYNFTTLKDENVKLGSEFIFRFVQ